ncbi:MAG: hypothetical protein ACE37M_04460 [Henriciella sp.]
MLHASTKKLIDRLAEMTELAKLDWAEGEDGTITYSTEGYSVSLTETPNEMVITSKDGKELERASADELASTLTDDGSSYAAIVAAMTSEAARVARGTETAISTLLAGMQEDAPADDVVATDDPITDEETGVELQEDPADETGVLTDESVEAISVESAQTETVSEEDGSNSDDQPDAIEVAAVPEATEAEETAAPEEDTVLEAAPIGEEEGPASDMADPTSEAEPESEDHVTEAVARLADEVNQRDETPLDTAAASAVGAVALAAGLSQDSDDNEPAQEEAETIEAEPASIIAAAEETISEPAPYVPFGLEAVEDTAGQGSVDEVAVVETEASDQVEAEQVNAFTFVAPIETETPAPVEPEAETISEPEPAPEPVKETVTTWGGISAEDSQPAEAASEPVEASEPVAETPDLAVASVVPAATEPEAEIVEEMIEPVAADEPNTPAVAETAPAEPQSYSLSGIGAGFGLGALSAKTEASGVPGPSGAGSSEEDKVVIDATEDVLPEIDGKPALPAGVAPIASTINVENPSDPSAAPQDAEGESDILKPRTRFNPWD